MDLNSVAHTFDDSTLKPNKNTKNNTYRYKIELSYRYVDSYTIIEETPRYTWDQLLSEIGRFLGLVIGASIISLLEILVCIIIKLFSLVEGTRTQRSEKIDKISHRFIRFVTISFGDIF